MHESGVGSLLINQNDLGERMFKALGFSTEEAQDQFASFWSRITGSHLHGGSAGSDFVMLWLVKK